MFSKKKKKKKKKGLSRNLNGFSVQIEVFSKKKKKGLSRNLNGFSVQIEVFSKRKKKKKKKKVFTETGTLFCQWSAQISRLFAQINRPFAQIFDDFRRFEPNGGATAPPAPPPPTAMTQVTVKTKILRIRFDLGDIKFGGAPRRRRKPLL